jgi:hypothetical protein
MLPRRSTSPLVLAASSALKVVRFLHRHLFGFRQTSGFVSNPGLRNRISCRLSRLALTVAVFA